MELIASATFGLEAVVKREIEALGCEIIGTQDGKITFKGDERDLVRANLWLRCAERVFVKIDEFKAETFTELFDQTKDLPWADWIPEDGKFTVVGTSVKSTLHSVPDCQAIIKKAVVEKLKEAYSTDWFEETGAAYTIRFAFQKDVVTVMIDSSGEGLHKRGYRANAVTAPIKETLASAMVQLSFYKHGRVLLDPFCGSGTIAIEAAMISRNIAPGLSKRFAFEDWKQIPQETVKEERKAAFSAILPPDGITIIASDIDKKAIEAARENAIEAGVDDCIKFEIADAKKAFKNAEKYGERGIVITNPPYGKRIGDEELLSRLCRDMYFFRKDNPTWSLFIISADRYLEKKLGGKADRRRKLFNGNIETTYYQFHGK